MTSTIGVQRARPRTPVPGEVLYNAQWCWWTKPRAFQHLDGKIYLGAIDCGGYVQIGSTAGDRYVLQPYLHRDDHNNPAVLTKPGRQPLMFYATHNIDTSLRWRLGTTVDRLDSWGSEQVITMPDLVTYAIAMYYGDEVFVFTRLTTGWAVVRSTGWGTGWQSSVTVFDLGTNNQAYLSAAMLADGVTVRCATTGNPRASVTVHDIYYFEINLATGSVTKSDGTVLGNIRTGASLPMTTANMEVAYLNAGGRTTNLFDISNGPIPEVVFGDKVADDNATTDAKYRYARRIGGVWTTTDIVAAGTKFGYAHNGFYVGGAGFPDPSSGGVVYLSRESSGTWTIEKHVTTDNGATWTPTVLATSSTSKLIRPWPIRDRIAGDPEVIYSNASYYDPLTFNNWETNLCAI